jgi:hypothetical protein
LAGGWRILDNGLVAVGAELVATNSRIIDKEKK